MAIEQFNVLDAKDMCVEYISKKLPEQACVNKYTIKDVEQFLGADHAENVMQLL